MKKLVALLASVSVVAGLSGCGLITKTPEGIKATVVARINDQKITKGEFDKKFESQLEQLKMMYGQNFADKKENQEYIKQMKEDFLSSLVEDALLVQEAKKENVIDDKSLEDEVKKQYDEQVKAAGGEEQFKKQLEGIKFSTEDFKEYLKINILKDKLYEKTTQNVTVSDEDAKKYYNDNIYQYTEKPNKMNISHILVATEKEAQDIKARLDKGEKFEDLAKQYSTDPGSKDKGGELGEFEYANNNLDKTFFINAIAVPEGKISAPFKTQFGWHIVRMNKKEEYNPKPFDTVKEEIKKTMLDSKKQEEFKKKIEEWKDKAKIKEYPERL
ncbi:peptidylprolyl isomerase [Fonticella tunisiensis]|nr:peptidylprolyl isomerase [Fonticella tunisiensis]